MQLFITGVGPAAVGATGEGVVGGGGGGDLNHKTCRHSSAH